MEYCVVLSTQREDLIFPHYTTMHLPAIMISLTNFTYVLLRTISIFKNSKV